VSREHETEIEIRAPRDAVWRALTDADELAKWFVDSARIEPREGGAYWRSFGEGLEAEARIEAWEPERRLRLVNPPVAQPDAPEKVWHLEREAEPMVEEYFLQARGEVTVLRVVQSGMPDSADWDGFYEGTRRGWRIAFAGLRFYLEHHRGEPRQLTSIQLTTPLSQEDAWNHVLACFPLRGNTGDRYRFDAPGGTPLEGEILIAIPTYGVLASVETLSDALLALRTQATAKDTMVWLILHTYGSQPALTQTQAAAWRSALGSAIASVPEPQKSPRGD
jgi:uncharacterized protein YndB with AHSA1/START domain